MRVFSFVMALGVMTAPAFAEPVEPLSSQAVANRLDGLLIYEADDFQIHMNSCVVDWNSADATDLSAIYLYQEQARHDRLGQPYRQRLLKISAPSPAVVTSDSYRLTAPGDWIGLCQREIGDRTFSKTDLQPAHCTVTLMQEGRKFIGATPEPGCPSQYRGAAFVRNRIILTPEGMETFDQGVDASGNHVWGAEDKPYRFKKVSSP